MLNLGPMVTDRILELALEGEKVEGEHTQPGLFDVLSAQTWPDRKLSEDNEEKVLSRLGITYGVLRRLGFTEEIVEECLRAINGVELEEAFDWVCGTIATLLPHSIHHHCSSTFIAPRNSIKAHVCTRIMARDSKLTACIRFRRSGRSWNAKIIHDWFDHTIIHPPDTPHPDSPTTLRIPHLNKNPASVCTLAIGRERPCISSFVCARTIATA